MNCEHFTLTISQNNTNSNDFAIHLKDNIQSEQLLAHFQFTQSPMFNDVLLHDIIRNVAEQLARQITEWRVAPDDHKLMKKQKKQVAETVNNIIQSLKN